MLTKSLQIFTKVYQIFAKN